MLVVLDKKGERMTKGMQKGDGEILYFICSFSYFVFMGTYEIKGVTLLSLIALCTSFLTPQLLLPKGRAHIHNSRL